MEDLKSVGRLSDQLNLTALNAERRRLFLAEHTYPRNRILTLIEGCKVEVGGRLAERAGKCPYRGTLCPSAGYASCSF